MRNNFQRRDRFRGVVSFTDEMTCCEIVAGEDFRSEFNGEERVFL